MTMENIIIREAGIDDLEEILRILRSAFESDEEADLVRSLLDDPSAEPFLSLLALVSGKGAGHILFTKAGFEPSIEVKGSLLGPLAVDPAYQNLGLGSKLIREGLQQLAAQGVDWVFVLGHESYYPRFGFGPALEQGFEPPYSIPAEFANAWMAQALTPTCIAGYKGKVLPADTLNDPRYWRE